MDNQAVEMRAYGEGGMPPLPNVAYTNAELERECTALVGHLAVVQSSPVNQDGSVGQVTNWIGEIKKVGDIFSIELSDRHATIVGFFIEHVSVASHTRALPEIGRKYLKVVRFTVWASNCHAAYRKYQEDLMAALNNRCMEQQRELELLKVAAGGAAARVPTGGFFTYTAPGDANLVDTSNWPEVINTKSEVNDLMAMLDSHYGLASGPMAGDARNNLRQVLLGAIEFGGNWAETHNAVNVRNAFVRYRVCMQAKGKEAEALRRMAPENNDPLGTFLSKVTSGPAASNIKCFKCGKQGHLSSNCRSKPSSSQSSSTSKNASGAAQK